LIRAKNIIAKTAKSVKDWTYKKTIDYTDEFKEKANNIPVALKFS
jgi:hypothetical protein